MKGTEYIRAENTPKTALKAIQCPIHIRISGASTGASGHYYYVIDGFSRQVSRRHLSLFLKRIYRASLYVDNWDIMFSHVVSHEYIHKVLHEEVNGETCSQFDNIAETWADKLDGTGL